MKSFMRFRNMTPYKVIPEGKQTPFGALQQSKFDELDHPHFIAADPTGSRREDTGLEAMGGEYIRDIDGKGVLMTIRMSKKMLPARVVKIRVEEMAQALEYENGRKPGRKERQALAEDAELELLPRAFIGYTYIPVIFTSDNRLFVFTTSQKRADTVITFLINLLTEIERIPFAMSSVLHEDGLMSVDSWMNSKAILVNEDESDLQVTDFVVMKEHESGTVRVSDRHLAGYSEMQSMITKGFRVKQIGLMYQPAGISFRLDGDLRLRMITLGDDTLLEFAENRADEGFDEMHAIVWLVIAEYRRVIDALMAELRAAPKTEEDEEL